MDTAAGRTGPAGGHAGDLFGAVPGRVNGLADVPGTAVGHAPARDSDGGELSSGVTVVATPAGAVGAVDVRGGGPGTRETDLLAPANAAQAVHAVALCGGSAFGLDAAGGVMAGLENHGAGLRVLGDAAPDLIVPIVPAAVIFDLPVGSPAERPDAACGREALERALGALDELPGVTGPALNGSVGAGRAATAGAVKGGFGQASAVLPSGVTVAVGLVTNPVGSVVDPATGLPWGLGSELCGEFDRYRDGDGTLPDPGAGGRERLLARGLGGTKLPVPGGDGGMSPLNTVIGVVATDAPVTKAQAQRLATSAHDGLARAVRPSHLPMDGDTFFALSTGGGGDTGAGMPVEDLAVLMSVAADCAERAVVHSVLAASSLYGVPSWKELMT
ncbi:MAG: P1 family peptidase [Corynebacterium provencense]|uniref:P1 family peptidase n=1 Tax=Corynebacterium provencense TaxID=1737425 RepID=UPI002989F285|nr:P1 family peptidase [Corynebacterium provencense]